MYLGFLAMYRGMKSIKPYNSKILFPAHLLKCTCWCQSRVSRRTRKPSKVCAGPCAMAPPVQAMVNALGHCKGFTPPNLDAVWTLQGRPRPIFERSSPIPERAGDSILSSRHRQDTARPKAPTRLQRKEQHEPIQTVAAAQSGVCGPVSHAVP